MSFITSIARHLVAALGCSLSCIGIPRLLCDASVGRNRADFNAMMHAFQLAVSAKRDKDFRSLCTILQASIVENTAGTTNYKTAGKC